MILQMSLHHPSKLGVGGGGGTLWEHIWDKADCLRNSLVFGPMVHELFNEDLGILTPQLKGPYGLEQLLVMTSVRTW